MEQVKLPPSMYEYWGTISLKDDDHDKSKSAFHFYRELPYGDGYLIALGDDSNLRYAGVPLAKREITMRITSYGLKLFSSDPVFKPLIEDIIELYNRVYSRKIGDNTDRLRKRKLGFKYGLDEHPLYADKTGYLRWIGSNAKGWIMEKEKALGMSPYPLYVLLD